MRKVAVEWQPGETVTMRIYDEARPVLLFAHGAGTDQLHDLVTGPARAIADRGLGVATFDYPYTAAGRRAPDRPAKLLACHAAVVERLTAISGAAPVLGGRSMGGRMATMLAATGTSTTGVVCVAYPLHPTGKPDRLRIEHLPDIEVPMLFFRGSRDTMATEVLFDEHVRSLRNATVIDLPGADHSMRGMGWTPAAVSDLIADSYARWVRHL